MIEARLVMNILVWKGLRSMTVSYTHLRAGSAAGTAVGALLLVHHGNAVFDMDGIELTGRHTGAETEAAIATGLGRCV